MALGKDRLKLMMENIEFIKFIAYIDATLEVLRKSRFLDIRNYRHESEDFKRGYVTAMKNMKQRAKEIKEGII